MKNYLILFWILVMTSSLMATQLQVVGEVLTTPGCGPCLPARSALRQMYEDKENFGNLIPLIWLGAGNYASPGYIERSVLYLRRGVPYSRWGGSLAHSGARRDVIEEYVQRYRQIVSNPSPLKLSLDIELTAENRLLIEAAVEMIESITRATDKIIFIVTYDLENELPGEDYFANVLRYAEEDFPLSSAGQKGHYTYSFDLEPWWDLTRVNVVVLIQSFDKARTIHQAASRRIVEQMIKE